MEGSMDTSGQHLVDHWGWAAQKGEMNKNTAAALKAACAQVLSVVEGWQQVDVKTLDVEDTLRRFENLRKKEFKPKTLDAYARRFKQALDSYLAYAHNPRGWKFQAQERAPRSRRTPNQVPQVGQEAEYTGPSGSPDTAALVEYPFPLRQDVTIRLALPRDLNMAEVKRLTAFMSTLALDFESPTSDR
jgi:hypothetical protein